MVVSYVLPSGETKRIHVLYEQGSQRDVVAVARRFLHARFEVGVLEVFVVLMMLVLLPVIAFTDPSTHLGVVEPVRSLGLAIFRSQLALQLLLLAAWIAHLLEACVAVLKARKLQVGGLNELSWFAGVFILGFPCLRFLLVLEQASKGTKKHR
uniref:Uncharacterized protein n=1 Tax=Hanusia phi TaxID=3032 RepID=A0A7S0E1N0_9CRYP|mmetsp:Transcript_14759/g.33903  ORF Transcript_14759/g.33903 Transcript_14759/m.33903 type:complete len:153 (+) Transcript_14759:1-459(+)